MCSGCFFLIKFDILNWLFWRNFRNHFKALDGVLKIHLQLQAFVLMKRVMKFVTILTVINLIGRHFTLLDFNLASELHG